MKRKPGTSINHGCPNWKIFGVRSFSLRESWIITYLAIINVFQTFFDACSKFSYFSRFSMYSLLYPISDHFFQSQKNHQNDQKTAKFHLPIGIFSQKIDWWRYFWVFLYRLRSKMPFIALWVKYDQKTAISRGLIELFRNFFNN